MYKIHCSLFESTHSVDNKSLREGDQKGRRETYGCRGSGVISGHLQFFPEFNPGSQGESLPGGQAVHQTWRTSAKEP